VTEDRAKQTKIPVKITLNRVKVTVKLRKSNGGPRKMTKIPVKVTQKRAKAKKKCRNSELGEISN
jgi:hypothetical protein